MPALAPSGGPSPLWGRAEVAQWGLNPILAAAACDDKRHMDRTLRETVARGDYVVDPQAVAVAMIARERARMCARRSAVLVTAKALGERPARGRNGHAASL